ncbi:MAG: hypothetical protein AAGF13_07290 [Pseudomonadota bacterium]
MEQFLNTMLKRYLMQLVVVGFVLIYMFKDVIFLAPRLYATDTDGSLIGPTFNTFLPIVLVGLFLAVRIFGVAAVVSFFRSLLNGLGNTSAPSTRHSAPKVDTNPWDTRSGENEVATPPPSPEQSTPRPAFEPRDFEPRGVKTKAPRPLQPKISAKDLGPPRKDRFANGPVSSSRRGFFS